MWKSKTRVTKCKLRTLFHETRAITSKFTRAIYRTREIIVFSLFDLLLYISRKENFPKHGLHFAGKGILLELLGRMYITVLHTLLAFRKQIFCDFSSRPTEPNKFCELIVDGIFKLFIYCYLATMDSFVLKENILLWCKQPTIYLRQRLYHKYFCLMFWLENMLPHRFSS